MSELELRVDDGEVDPLPGWSATWIDRAAGIARLGDGIRSATCVVEGAGTDWVVTLNGRRIAVTVRSWRERMLAEAESAVAHRGGPIEVRATLPGLVVDVSVSEGEEVVEGSRLLTIEAMKMQNEVRSPRAGRVAAVAVSAGQAVAAGAPLLRIE